MSMTYCVKNANLGDVCEIQSGYAARSGLVEDAKSGVRAIQLRDLQDEQVQITATAKFRLDGKLNRYLVEPGDVLFRSRGENNTASIVIGDTGEVAVALQP